MLTFRVLSLLFPICYLGATKISNSSLLLVPTTTEPPAVRNGPTGVFLLGMHRSGTSLATHLMSTLGLSLGSVAKGDRFNAKGYFEHLEVIDENERILREQNLLYHCRCYKYNWKTAVLGMLKTNSSDLSKALSFYNDNKNMPWIMKDPRLCITMKSWESLLHGEQVAVISFRHPIDSAISMKKRDRFSLDKGLRLWYVYNRQAVLNSRRMCRVVTSLKKIVDAPTAELSAIKEGLIRCGLELSTEINVNLTRQIIDLNLQHNKATVTTDSCKYSLNKLPINMWFGREFKASLIQLFAETLRVYCAMEDGSAFGDDFNWDMDIHDENC